MDIRGVCVCVCFSGLFLALYFKWCAKNHLENHAAKLVQWSYMAMCGCIWCIFCQFSQRFWSLVSLIVFTLVIPHTNMNTFSYMVSFWYAQIVAIIILMGFIYLLRNSRFVEQSFRCYTTHLQINQNKANFSIIRSANSKPTKSNIWTNFAIIFHFINCSFVRLVQNRMHLCCGTMKMPSIQVFKCNFVEIKKW